MSLATSQILPGAPGGLVYHGWYSGAPRPICSRTPEAARASTILGPCGFEPLWGLLWTRRKCECIQEGGPIPTATIPTLPSPGTLISLQPQTGSTPASHLHPPTPPQFFATEGLMHLEKEKSVPRIQPFKQ
jgi:hypothetical protein